MLSTVERRQPGRSARGHVHTAVYTTGKGNIGGRNLPDGDPFIVSQRTAFEWMPDISNNRVVWWESGGRIMLRNLKTDKRSFVHTGSRPRVDGELVTWDGGGHGGEFVISYVRTPSLRAQRRAQHRRRRHHPEGPHLPLPLRQRPARGVGVGAGPAGALAHPHLRGATPVTGASGGRLTGGGRDRTPASAGYEEGLRLLEPLRHGDALRALLHAVPTRRAPVGPLDRRRTPCSHLLARRLSYMWASL